MYSWFCSFLLKPFVSRVNRRIAETLPYRDVADHRGNPNCGCRPDPAESDPAATRGKLALDARPHHQVGAAPGASAPQRGYAGRQCSGIQYEFSLGDRVIRGTRVTIGEMAGAGTEETLDRYPVGGTVPVYSLVAIALVFFGLALFFSGAFR